MFDYKGYKELQDILSKKAQFVPMGGDPAAAGAPPMDPDAMGGAIPPDAAGGMPPGGDPATMGAPPMDPAAAGAPPMDPAAMGMDPASMGMPDPAAGDVSPSGEPYMKITPTQLSKLFKQFAEVFKSVLGIQAPQQGAAPMQAPQQDPQLAAKVTEVDAKLNALINQIGG